MSSRFVVLGDGRKLGLGRYLAAWRACLALDPDTPIGRGVDGWGQNAGEALRDLRDGLHDRINRHIPGYGKGRKWDHDWQRATLQCADRVNSPRLIVRLPEIPPHLRARLAHRVHDDSY